MSVKYAYGYIRVSTHDQEEISPDSQEHLLRDYAAKNNIVILKIFTDLGISGRKANKRPGFQEMIGLAKGDDHPVDQILVWKFSRFARNQEESIVYKSLLKKQHNVDVVSVSDRAYHRMDGRILLYPVIWRSVSRYERKCTPRSIPGTSAAWLQGCGAWQAAGDCSGRSKDCSDYIRKIHK